MMGNLLNKRKLSDELYYSYTDHEDDDEFEEIFTTDEALCMTQDYIPDVNNDKQKETFESVADILSRVDRECNILITKWKAEQLFLKSRLNFQEDDEDFLQNIKYIGGVDISFPKDDCIHACACLVILSYPALEIVYKDCQMVHLTSVYIPGFLAFREVEPLHLLCDKLLQTNPQLYPQVILVDGNGVLHTQKFGLASHLGVVLNLSTIGVAKKLFHVDGLEKNNKFKTSFQEQCTKKGDTLDLVGESGFLYGRAFRSTDKSLNPIFVSVGNKISLDTSIEIVNTCCKYRVPEPVRLADQLSREYLRTSYSQHIDECGGRYAQLNSRFQMLTKEVQNQQSKVV